MKELFDTNIKHKYYSIIKDNSIIYTNLYDIEDIKNNNKQIILDDIQLYIIFLPYKKRDVNIIKQWKPTYPYPINSINNKLLKDKLFVMMIVNHCGLFILYIDPSLKNDEEIIKTAALSKYYRYKSLQYIQEEYKKNKNLFVYLCNIEGLNIQYASDELKNDNELVDIALNNNINSFPYISDNFRNNEIIIEKCIQIAQFTNNRSSINRPSILDYVTSDIIKDNKNIMMKLMEQNGSQIRYVSDRLRNDYDVVSTAIKQDPYCAYLYGNINESLYYDKKIILFTLNQPDSDIDNYSDFMNNFSEFPDILDDKEIVSAAINKSGKNFKFISERLQNDKEIVIKSLMNCYDTSEYDEYYYDRYFEYIKYMKNLEDEIENILDYTSESLKKDSDVLQVIINKKKDFFLNICKASHIN